MAKNVPFSLGFEDFSIPEGKQVVHVQVMKGVTGNEFVHVVVEDAPPAVPEVLATVQVTRES